MRFEVPQFIEIEDKIVGPLTWRQFIYLAGGAGVLVVLFIKTNIVVTSIIGLPIGILAIALAFHRVNNRAFSFFLEAFLNYSTKKKLYLWKKEREQIIVEKESFGHTESPHTPNLEFARKRSISALARKLDVSAPES